MSDQPLVSVVTPTLNRADFLAAALDSVAAQTYPNVEHIVVDGGSSDGTPDLLARRTSPRLRWISEPDSGMYAAVNKGMRLAEGTMLAYLNSDDLYFPWTIECAVAGLQETGADVVFGDLVRWRPGERGAGLAVYGPFSRSYLRRHGSLAQPTVFMHRRVLDQIGNFDESLQHVADCDYWMRASSRFRIAKVNEVLAVERDHPGAKRIAAAAEVAAELAIVRSRHGAGRPELPVLAVRAGMALALRAQIARLALAVARGRAGSRGAGPWSKYAASDLGARTSVGHLWASLLPVVGKRFLAQALRSALAANSSERAVEATVLGGASPGIARLGGEA
jgi:hypothetical protein